MPRNVLRNRVHGCMIESHVGGNAPDEFKVLDFDDKTPLVACKTMASATATAKVLTGVRDLGNSMNDPADLSSVLGAVKVVLDRSTVEVQERQAALAAKEQKQAAEEAAAQQAVQPTSAPTAPVQAPPVQQQQQQPAQAAPVQQQDPVQQPVQQAPPVQQPAAAPAVTQEAQPAPQQAPAQQVQAQEPTNGGADPGWVHDGGATADAGAVAASPQPADPAPAVAADPAVVAAAPAEGVAQGAAEAAPGTDGVSLLGG